MMGDEFGDVLIEMIIGEDPNYYDIQDCLLAKNKEHPEFDWEAVGDRITSKIKRQGDERDDTIGGERFFTMLNLLDFAMQAYEMAGEKAVLKKIERQFVLARHYSDQAGLKRKFELFEEIVETAYPLIVNRSFDDRMNYYFTRSLNRLAALSFYWRGEEEAERLYERLALHGKDSETSEQEEIFSVISEFAYWFVEKRPELFTHANLDSPE